MDNDVRNKDSDVRNKDSDVRNIDSDVRNMDRNGSDVRNIDSFGCSYSGHQLLMSRIWTVSTVHVPNINLSMYRTSRNPSIVYHVITPEILHLVIMARAEGRL